MPLSRRQLLRGAGLAATWMGAGRVLDVRAAGPEALNPAHPAHPAHPAMPMRHAAPIKRPLHAAALPRFVDALPVPPVLQSAETRPDPARPKRAVPLYRVTMRAIEVQVHRDLPPTRC